MNTKINAVDTFCLPSLSIHYKKKGTLTKCFCYWRTLWILSGRYRICICLFPGLITNITFTKTPCLSQHWCSTYKSKFYHLLNLRNFKEFWRWKKEIKKKKKGSLHLSCPTQDNDDPTGKNPSNMMNWGTCTLSAFEWSWQSCMFNSNYSWKQSAVIWFSQLVVNFLIHLWGIGRLVIQSCSVKVLHLCPQMMAMRYSSKRQDGFYIHLNYQGSTAMKPETGCLCLSPSRVQVPLDQGVFFKY